MPTVYSNSKQIHEVIRPNGAYVSREKEGRQEGLRSKRPFGPATENWKEKEKGRTDLVNTNMDSTSQVLKDPFPPVVLLFCACFWSYFCFVFCFLINFSTLHASFETEAHVMFGSGRRVFDEIRGCRALG